MQKRILSIVTVLFLGLAIFVQPDVSASVKKINYAEIGARQDSVNAAAENQSRKGAFPVPGSKKFCLQKRDGHQVNHSS